MNDESNDEPMKRENPVVRALREIGSHVPPTSESRAEDPFLRANQIVHYASLKAAALSAALAIPPGPAGLATVAPDLIGVWKIQQQMVADIAGCFGKTAQLEPELMLYCLFRHGAAMLVRDVVMRTGERILVKRASLRVFQQLLGKLGVNITQKLIGKSISRFVPFIGPMFIGGYSYYDTRQIGMTAIDTFSREIIDGEDGAAVPA